MRALLGGALTALILASAPAGAQQVHLVSRWDGIDPAIAAAQPGDVIELLPSVSYEPFTLNKGVTVRGRGAYVGYQPGFNNFVLTARVPPGQVGVLEGLDLSQSYSPYGSYGVSPTIDGGSVRLEGIDFGTTLGPLLVRGGSVVVVDCSLTKANDTYEGPAVRVEGASVELRDCTFTGGPAACAAFGCFQQNFATPAVEVQDGTVRIERCALRGGDHSTTRFSGFGAPALRAIRSTVTVADASLQAGVDRGGVQAPALENAGPDTVELRATTLLGGQPLTVGPVDPNAPLVRLARDTRWRRGQTSVLTVAGDAGAVFAVLLASSAAPTSSPLVGDPVWAMGGDTWFGGVLDSAGRASLQLAVPSAAGLEHVSAWLQAFSGLQLPLRASTLAGGIVD
jgi:hypothetical protein